MTWLRIDDKMWRNPKVRALSPKAFRVHVSAMCLCAEWETDGVVTKAMAKEIGATKAALKELEKVQITDKKPLWICTESGWQINDYLDYNPSRAELAEQKQNRRNKAKKAASARWGAKDPEYASSSVPSNAPSIGHVDAPVPVPPSSTPTVVVDAANGHENTSLPPALIRILPDDLPQKLRPGQAQMITQAWEANSTELRQSLAASNRSNAR